MGYVLKPQVGSVDAASDVSNVKGLLYITQLADIERSTIGQLFSLLLLIGVTDMQLIKSS